MTDVIDAGTTTKRSRFTWLKRIASAIALGTAALVSFVVVKALRGKA